MNIEDLRSRCAPSFKNLQEFNHQDPKTET